MYVVLHTGGGPTGFDWFWVVFAGILEVVHGAPAGPNAARSPATQAPSRHNPSPTPPSRSFARRRSRRARGVRAVKVRIPLGPAPAPPSSNWAMSECGRAKELAYAEGHCHGESATQY